ncbi:MAG: RpiB/LacA/LacB family sugar-phosphate isomerase [Candidatus Saccharimonadales bacterium]|jgi:ribose 5-phosphate isomerase B
MKLYIGADHNGFELKAQLSAYLQKLGYEVGDEGDEQRDPDDDFPQFAARTISALMGSDDTNARGILICGSGQGMCMAANRFKGIRASLCWDDAEARASRNDDDSNVLCLPARYIDVQRAEDITKVWLETAFAGAPRFKRRIRELDEIGG